MKSILSLLLGGGCGFILVNIIALHNREFGAVVVVQQQSPFDTSDHFQYKNTNFFSYDDPRGDAENNNSNHNSNNNHNDGRNDKHKNNNSNRRNNNKDNIGSNKVLGEGFAACLMVKDDNDLLYEWIAYHYEMMPLRHLVVGSDVGSQQDPIDVLQRWNGTDLRYWVLKSDDFVLRHGPGWQGHDPNPHHNQLVHRQRGFLTTCLELLKAQKGNDNNDNIQWVLLTDSDEFFVIHRFRTNKAGANDGGGDDGDAAIHAMEKKPGDNLAIHYEMRKALSSWEPNGYTVLDAIRKIERDVQELSSCVVLPRLRFGIIENITTAATSCGVESDRANRIASQKFDLESMSTLRYKVHTNTTNFKMNGFGKVMLDLSRIPKDTISTEYPRNIHRPFRQLCVRPIAWYAEAVFTLNHYSTTWERYKARNDKRRSCESWMKTAFLDDGGNSCQQRIHRWFPRFIRRFGLEKAQHLLGVHRQRQRHRQQQQQQQLSGDCPPSQGQ